MISNKPKRKKKKVDEAVLDSFLNGADNVSASSESEVNPVKEKKEGKGRGRPTENVGVKSLKATSISISEENYIFSDDIAFYLGRATGNRTISRSNNMS